LLTAELKAVVSDTIPRGPGEPDANREVLAMVNRLYNQNLAAMARKIFATKPYRLF